MCYRDPCGASGAGGSDTEGGSASQGATAATAGGSQGETDSTSETGGLPPFWPGTACKSEAEEQDEAGGLARIHFDLEAGKVEGKDFFRLPFPDDIRRGQNTIDLEGFPVPPPEIDAQVGGIVGAIVDAAARDTSGYAVNGAVLFRATHGLDANVAVGVGKGGGVRLVNVTPGRPGYGKAISIAFRYEYGSASRGTYICQNWLGIQPFDGQALETDTTYAAILTSKIKPAGATGFSRDDDFEVMMATTAPSDAGLRGSWDKYQALRDFLGSPENNDPTGEQIAADDVIAASVFTTGDHLSVMSGAEATAKGVPLAVADLTLCSASTDSPCAGLPGLTAEEDAARRCGSVDPAFHEIHGRVTLPIYQEGSIPYARDGGAISTSAGAPIQRGTDDVCFALTVPKGQAKPAAGWPVIIHGHGTGGSFRAAAGDVARSAAAAGFATLTLEGIHHGQRRKDTDDDGMVDGLDRDTLVFNVFNPESARDTLIQGAIDQFGAVRIALGFSSDAVISGETLDFDAANIFYFGHSQGSQVGIPFVAHSSDIKAAVFSGAGSNLIKSLLAKKKPMDVAGSLKIALLESGSLTDFHPLLNLVNIYVNRADADVHAPLLVRSPVGGQDPRHVLLYLGHVDNYTPLRAAGSLMVNSGVELGGGTLFPEPCNDHSGDERVACSYTANGFLGETGLPATGNLASGGVTAVGVMLDGRGLEDGHFVAFETAELDRIVAFFETALGGAVPTVAP